MCEAVYADEVATPAFSKLFGELVNGMMAQQNARQALVNKILSGMGLPNRNDSQALIQALQGLREEQKENLGEIRQLRHRCDQLEKKVSKAGRPTKSSTKRKKTSVVKKGKNKKLAKRTKAR